MNVLGCHMVSTARTQGTLALSSGEAELYAIGQGVSKLAKTKKVSVIAPH